MKNQLSHRLVLVLIGILLPISAAPVTSLGRADDYGHTSRVGCSGYDFIAITGPSISIVTHGSPARSGGQPWTAIAIIESAANGQQYQMSPGVHTVRPGAYNHTTNCSGSGTPLRQVYSEIHYN
jgi:hypothetical protein